MVFTLSIVEFSGITNTILTPKTFAIKANAIPVFPLVASTKVSPFLIFFLLSASEIML